MPKLRVFSGAELCDLLAKQGFERVRQRGSHVIMRPGNRFVSGAVAPRGGSRHAGGDHPPERIAAGAFHGLSGHVVGVGF